MADEANVPSHRWYQKQNHVLLAKQHVTKALILSAGAAMIPTDDLGAAVEAILSGTAGFAFDPIAANLKQDAAGATPVVNVADPIGRMNCQWGSAPPNFQIATAGFRPAWDGTGVAYDGTDDYFSTFSNLGIFSNAPGAFHCERFNITDLAVDRRIISFSEASTQARFEVAVATTGSVTFAMKLIDGGTSTIISTATGLILAGVDYTISAECDGAGTGNMRLWIDDTLIETKAIVGAPGNFTAANSNRCRKGGNLGGATPVAFYKGNMRRFVTTPYAVSDANRATIKAWVDAA